MVFEKHKVKIIIAQEGPGVKEMMCGFS